MQPYQTIKKEIDPRVQLLLVLVYAFLGVLIVSIISFVIVVLIYGTSLIRDLSWLTGADPKYFGAVKIMLTGQQIGLFLLPALALAITERQKPQHFYGFAPVKINWLLLVFFIMVSSVPIMGWINELNQHMTLPDFLKSVEAWMKAKEAEAAKTTEAILKMNSIGDLFVSLFVIALVPAICEELFFRGALQRTFLRWIKNPHIGIWIVAIVFSAIHLQFFGFFPRMILGLMFGYIYFWTGSLRYTMFAHFLNNGYAVIITYLVQRNKISLNETDDINFAWYGYVISAGITLALFFILKNKTDQQKID